MAKYTTQIRSIVESGYPLFDFDYPIFDESYRSVLEQKIINRFLFREIGFETVAQFKHFLKTKLNEIMPYYNQHYLALEVFQTYDPYKNKNVTTTDKRTNTQNTNMNTTASGSTVENGSSNGASTNTANTVFSDTPQARLQGLDYATNVTDVNDTGTTNLDTSSSAERQEQSSGTGNVTTVDEYISTIAGHDGMKYPSDILKDLRATFINIDTMILDELNDLFMNIY